MKKKFEEGQEAKEKFERTMTTLFQVKKAELAEKIKKKPKKGKDKRLYAPVPAVSWCTVSVPLPCAQVPVFGIWVLRFPLRVSSLRIAANCWAC
jgi:hypothetical protein